MYNPEQVAATHLEADGIGYGDFAKRYAFTYADMTSKVFGVPVDAGSLVVSVRFLVTVAFEGGGAEDLSVGDSASAWLRKMVVSGLMSRLTPPAIAVSLSPSRRLWQARCTATSADEQAVSITMLGPCKPRT